MLLDDTAAPFEMTVRVHPEGYVEATAAGEIDFDTHRRLLDTLIGEIDRGHVRIVLDLGGVTFCDSTGLGALVRLCRETAARQGWFRVADPTPVVRRTIEGANVDRLIPIFQSVAEATRYL
jgi:anti-sigma B factor antagonist